MDISGVKGVIYNNVFSIFTNKYVNITSLKTIWCIICWCLITLQYPVSNNSLLNTQNNYEPLKSLSNKNSSKKCFRKTAKIISTSLIVNKGVVQTQIQRDAGRIRPTNFYVTQWPQALIAHIVFFCNAQGLREMSN